MMAAPPTAIPTTAPVERIGPENRGRDVYR